MRGPVRGGDGPPHRSGLRRFRGDLPHRPSLRLTLRLHETRSGTLLSTTQAEGSDAGTLDTGVKAAVGRLLAKIAPANQRWIAAAGLNPLRLWTTREERMNVSLLAGNGGFGCEQPL